MRQLILLLVVFCHNKGFKCSVEFSKFTSGTEEIATLFLTRKMHIILRDTHMNTHRKSCVVCYPWNKREEFSNHFAISSKMKYNLFNKTRG